MENKIPQEIALAVEYKPTELETSDLDRARTVLDISEKLDDLETDIEDLNTRVNWLERALHDDRPANEWPNIDVVARINAKWSPRHDEDADVTRCIAEISDVGDGDIRIDVGDTTIWIPRWQFCGALNALHIWRD